MENSIRELIESATVNGSISDTERDYIIKKASEIGIDEIEVNIFIKANLQKNQDNRETQNKSIKQNESFIEEGWLKFSEFKLGNWILLISVVLMFFSGFLPWVKSSVSGTVLNNNYGSSGSIGGGIFYTLPLSIAAIIFAMKRNLKKFCLFFGVFVIIVAIGLVASYTSKVSGSAGLASVSASTGAGPGVLFLGLSGLIFIIGSLITSSVITIDKISKNRSIITHDYTIISIILITILIPLSFNNYKFNLRLFDSLLYASFFGVIPFLLSKYKKFNNTKNILIGNFVFWGFIILFPHNYYNSSFLYYVNKSFNSILNYYQYFFSFICISALIYDYFESKSKKIIQIEKYKILFKSFIVGMGFLIPLTTLILLSTLTKHRVSSEELTTFNERNLNFDGYWYFINSDSTRVDMLTLDLTSNISPEENGDIIVNVTAEVDEYESNKFTKNNFKTILEIDYSSNLIFPIKFDESFQIKSIKNEVLTCNIKTSEGKSINIIAKREISELEAIINNKKNSVNINENNEKINYLSFKNYEESDLVYYIFEDDKGTSYNFSSIPNTYKLIDENNNINQQYLNKKFKIKWKAIAGTDEEFGYPYNEIISIELIN